MGRYRPRANLARKSQRLPVDQIYLLRSSASVGDAASALRISPQSIQRWESGADRSRLRLSGGRLNDKEVPFQSAPYRFADLFAGIGGFRMAFENAGATCVFTSEWNEFASDTYNANFINARDHVFAGDITKVAAPDIPDHDILLAGFPCQPFSIAGVSKKNSLGRLHGFLDPNQGNLFFEITRILDSKRPRAFVLENVKNLLSHDQGRTFEIIRHSLEIDLGYSISFEVIDSRHWVPQGRKRIIIVGIDQERYPVKSEFDFDLVDIPAFGPKLRNILHPENGTERPEEPFTFGEMARVSDRYTLTPALWTYLRNYASKHRSAGNGFGYGLVGPDDIARTLSARYFKDGSEILVQRPNSSRPRRLTPRECARLMGFPDSFQIPVSDTNAYRQFGNSVVVPMMTSIAESLISQLDQLEISAFSEH